MPQNFNPLACAPYPGAVNDHGEIETLKGVAFTHWHSSVLRSRYHYVSAGDPANPPIVFLHGLPESWYAMHYQMAHLASDYFCIGLDLKGYGQSEKSLDEEYSFAHCAFELGLLLDKLGIHTFSLVGHDRGSVLGDHLCNLPNGFNQRITKFARMQQSANHPHAQPRPPHKLFASNVGSVLFSSQNFPTSVYARQPVTPPPEEQILRAFGKLEAIGVPLRWRKTLFQRALARAANSNNNSDAPQGHQLTHGEIDPTVIARIHREFHLPGVAEAVPLTFRLTNFDKEYEDRSNFLFDNMTMPVRFIQGELDPGQPASDYIGLEEIRPNFSIQWIADAGHFLHLENPQAVNKALEEFFAEAD